MYWQMCKVVKQNPVDLVQTSLAREQAEGNVVNNFPPLETICDDINRLLTPIQQDQASAEMTVLNSDNKSEATISHLEGLPTPQDHCKPDNSADNESKYMVMESEPEKESGSLNEEDTEMGETKNDAELNENTEKSGAGIIVLDD